MRFKINSWEFLYIFISSTNKGLLWIVSFIFTAFIYRLTTKTPDLDIPLLIGFGLIYFVVMGFVLTYITKKIAALKNKHNEIIGLIREDRNRHLNGITNREGRCYPDEGKVDTSEYNRLISSISEKGYIEFTCHAFLDKIANQKEPIFLYKVFPGMFKIYLVGSLDFTKADESLAFRLYSPENVDLRDFSITWFDNILKILGNSCKSISDLQAQYIDRSESEVSGEFFHIQRYKYFKRKKAHIFRIYID